MMMQVFNFYKEKNKWHDKYHWYIDLPEWEGGKDALEMVEGADTMLDILLSMSETKNNRVSLNCSLQPFENCNILELLKEDDICGGGHYILKKYNDVDLNLNVWLCDVTKFIYGYMPKILYFK